MNILTQKQTITISSKDIARECDNRHANVIRDIRAFIDPLKDDSNLSHDIKQLVILLINKKQPISVIQLRVFRVGISI